MARTIENMWKDGFLDSKALVAPKVNDLYNRKSVHLIEKFERMFSRNIKGIMIGASIIFIASYFVGALWAGSIVLLMMLYVAYTAKEELRGLEALDKGASSYTFLSNFKEWISNSIERYGSMYRIVYPLLILCFYFGIWFSDVFSPIREKVLESSDQIFLGVHIYSTLLVIITSIVMSVFSKRIHREDVETIYGGILKKLDLALEEMEELRKTGGQKPEARSRK